MPSQPRAKSRSPVPCRSNSSSPLPSPSQPPPAPATSIHPTNDPAQGAPLPTRGALSVPLPLMPPEPPHDPVPCPFPAPATRARFPRPDPTLPACYEFAPPAAPPGGPPAMRPNSKLGLGQPQGGHERSRGDGSSSGSGNSCGSHSGSGSSGQQGVYIAGGSVIGSLSSFAAASRVRPKAGDNSDSRDASGRGSGSVSGSVSGSLSSLSVSPSPRPKARSLAVGTASHVSLMRKSRNGAQFEELAYEPRSPSKKQLQRRSSRHELHIHSARSSSALALRTDPDCDSEPEEERSPQDGSGDASLGPAADALTTEGVTTDADAVAGSGGVDGGDAEGGGSSDSRTPCSSSCGGSRPSPLARCSLPGQPPSLFTGDDLRLQSRPAAMPAPARHSRALSGPLMRPPVQTAAASLPGAAPAPVPPAAGGGSSGAALRYKSRALSCGSALQTCASQSEEEEEEEGEQGEEEVWEGEEAARSGYGSGSPSPQPPTRTHAHAATARQRSSTLLSEGGQAWRGAAASVVARRAMQAERERQQELQRRMRNNIAEARVHKATDEVASLERLLVRLVVANANGGARRRKVDLAAFRSRTDLDQMYEKLKMKRHEEAQLAAEQRQQLLLQRRQLQLQQQQLALQQQLRQSMPEAGWVAQQRQQGQWGQPGQGEEGGDGGGGGFGLLRKGEDAEGWGPVHADRKSEEEDKEAGFLSLMKRPESRRGGCREGAAAGATRREAAADTGTEEDLAVWLEGGRGEEPRRKGAAGEAPRGKGAGGALGREMGMQQAVARLRQQRLPAGDVAERVQDLLRRGKEAGQRVGMGVEGDGKGEQEAEGEEAGDAKGTWQGGRSERADDMRGRSGSGSRLVRLLTGQGTGREGEEGSGPRMGMGSSKVPDRGAGAGDQGSPCLPGEDGLTARGEGRVERARAAVGSIAHRLSTLFAGGGSKQAAAAEEQQ